MATTKKGETKAKAKPETVPEAPAAAERVEAGDAGKPCQHNSLAQDGCSTVCLLCGREV